MKGIFSKSRRAAGGLLVTAMASVAGALDAFAKDDMTVDWIESSNSGVFDTLIETAKETMGSFYTLAVTVGSGLLLILLILGFIKLSIFSGQMREQQKGALFYVLLGIMGIASAVSIFNLVSGIGSGVFQ